MIDLVKNCSITSRRIKGSAIRELLKMTNKPDMISFAGGLPSPDSFPAEEIERLATKVLREQPAVALQYGATDGDPVLKDEIIKIMEKDGFKNLTRDHILITASSQQGLDLVGRIFIDPIDPVLVELPTYLGGLQAFNAYGATFIGIKSDSQGMDIQDLSDKLKQLRHTDEHYKFAYIVPDFQNPSGITWTLERRKQLIELAEKYNLLVIDDSPYRELRFEGTKPPALATLCSGNNVITLRTFSKIFTPGLRLGWIVADPAIISKLSVAKQSVDLCTSPLVQLIAAEYLKTGQLEGQVQKIVEMYRAKRDLMISCLEKYMPKEVHWVKPEGGLFLWLQLPEHMSADEMFKDALDAKVAYVIGSAFHCNGKGQNTMRLNFSYATHKDIDTGIKRLADVIKKRI